MNERLIWPALFALGCYHGINPAMGWLFAVGLGFQDRSAAAVVRAMIPLTLGHVLSVAAIVLVATFASAWFPHWAVHYVSASLLVGFGIYRLVRARHIRWVGMRVGFLGLTLWGFLMSSAHGAGLMLLPFVAGAAAMPPSGMSMPGAQVAHHVLYLGWLMVGVHTLGYALTAGSIALVVYAKFGVRFLRTGWVNLDLIWSIALIFTGIIALIF